MAREQLTLTDAERLLIQRRRLGETQDVAADRHGVTINAYVQVERGNRPVLAKALCVDLPNEKDDLNDFEDCFLRRRRAGYKQQKVADEIGCCRWWFNQMERGLVNPSALVEYWDAHDGQ